MELQEKIIKYIDKFGHKVKVNRRETMEVLNYSFTIKKFNYTNSDYNEKYVIIKLGNYKWDIRRVITLLKININSRQGIIQFDTKKVLPECIVNMQFLIRDKCLYCIVNSRSLDVKTKLYTDIEIAKRFCEKIEKNFDVKLSSIKFNVGSLHYYL